VTTNQNTTIQNDAIKGMMWSTLGSFTFQIVRVLSQIILARLLFPEAFGILAIVLSFVTVINYLIDNGLSLYIIRIKEIDDEKIFTVFIANLIFAIMAYIILFLFSPLITQYFNENSLDIILKWTSLAIIFNALGSVHKSLLSRSFNFKGLSIVSLVSAIIAGIFAIILALLNFGIWTLVVYHLLFQVIQTTLLLLKYNYLKLSNLRLDFFKEAFHFSWKLMVSGLLNTLYENFFNIVVGAMYSISALGYYSNALKIRDGITQILLDSIQRVSFSYLSKFQEQKEMLKNTTKLILEISVLLISPLLIGIAVTSDSLVRIVFGELWLGMIPIIQVLCISGLLIPLHRINLTTLTVVGRTDLYLRIELMKKLILVFIVVVSAIYKIELLSLLKILLVNSLFVVFVNSYYSKTIMNYSILTQIKDYLIAMFPAFIMGLVVYSIPLILNGGLVLSFLLQVLFGVLVFTLLCSILYKKEIKNLLFFIRNK